MFSTEICRLQKDVKLYKCFLTLFVKISKNYERSNVEQTFCYLFHLKYFQDGLDLVKLPAIYFGFAKKILYGQKTARKEIVLQTRRGCRCCHAR